MAIACALKAVAITEKHHELDSSLAGAAARLAEIGEAARHGADKDCGSTADWGRYILQR